MSTEAREKGLSDLMFFLSVSLNLPTEHPIIQKVNSIRLEKRNIHSEHIEWFSSVIFEVLELAKQAGKREALTKTIADCNKDLESIQCNQ